MDENREAYFNVARVCRFCLSQAGVMSPIFENGDPCLPSLAAKIMAFARVQLFLNDGLPAILCHRCLYLAEKAFDFKNQCEASDSMLRKYLTMMQAAMPQHPAVKTESISSFSEQCQTNKVENMSLYPNSTTDVPFKRKRGRPRKEENLIFYSSPVHPTEEPDTASLPNDEIKLVDGIESLVTVVDPRSDILSNSDEESKKDKIVADVIERDRTNADTLRSLAIARAKAKKYMGLIVGEDDNGTKTRRHLCKGCGKTFGHCSDLRKHVLVHTGERPFHCQLCTKTFSRSTNLNKHLKVHSGQKPFTCSSCAKSFATKGDLQRHLVIHSGIKPFSCDLCHQCFSRKDKLTRHVKLHGAPYSTRVNNRNNWTGHSIGVAEDEDKADLTNDDQEFIKMEEDSSEEFIDSETVSQNADNCVKHDVESMVINIDPFHMESDINDSIKNYDASDEAVLALMKKEYDPRPCTHCPLTFGDGEQLNAHMASHSGDKPHKCVLCPKSFSRKRELVRHENVHTGLKPYSCQICEKAFARKDKLARHKKIHEGFKPPGKKMFCKECNLGFYKESLYLEHCLTHSTPTDSDDDEHYIGENGCIYSDDGNSDDESTAFGKNSKDSSNGSVAASSSS